MNASMRILDRYVAGLLIRTSLLVLLLLTGLFVFFTTIDQLKDTGRGAFGLYNAFEYVILTMPRTIAEVFPIAAVIGAMITLGLLARNSELTVIRAAGVSQLRLLYALFKGGLILVLIALLVAEVIMPAAEQTAQQRRSLALADQIQMDSKYGFWVRDGDSYINIRQIMGDNEFRRIFIYEFDSGNRLRTSTRAQRATYRDGQWLLHDLQTTYIDEQQITQSESARAIWESDLNPNVINLVIVAPDYLTLPELSGYIQYLEANNQNTLRYQQALWRKLVYPFSILVLIALAVPLVKPEARSGAIGQRIFIGALIGILFHTLNQAMGHLGLVFALSPALSAILPSALFFLATLWLIRRSA